jgi:hypothetical protein
VGTVTSSSGTDDIGTFTAKAQKWSAGGVVFTTTIKVYAKESFAVFETTVPDGATGTNASIPIVPGGWQVARNSKLPFEGEGSVLPTFLRWELLPYARS